MLVTVVITTRVAHSSDTNPLNLVHLTHPSKERIFFTKFAIKVETKRKMFWNLSSNSRLWPSAVTSFILDLKRPWGLCAVLPLASRGQQRRCPGALRGLFLFFSHSFFLCCFFFWQISVGHRQKRVEAVEEKILCARSGMQAGKMMFLQNQESVPGSREAFSDLYVGSRPRLIWPLLNISTHFTSCLHLLLKWKFNLKIHHLFVNRFIKNA